MCYVNYKSDLFFHPEYDSPLVSLDSVTLALQSLQHLNHLDYENFPTNFPRLPGSF